MTKETKRITKEQKSRILKDIDSLQYDKQHGFYDKNLDMYFTTLQEWLQFNYNINIKEVL